MMVKKLLSIAAGGLIIGMAPWVVAQQEEPVETDQAGQGTQATDEVEELTVEDLQQVAEDEAEAEETTAEDEAEEQAQEAENVEVTVSELQQMINMPQGATIKEFQEDPENPKSLFDSEEDVERIFDEEPSFIYFPEAVDPMIIPWVRNQVVAQELSQEAQIAVRNNDYEKAKTILRRIQEQYPNTEQGQKAPNQIAQINQQIEQERQAQQESAQQVADQEEEPSEPEPELPAWVQRNTTGVMIDSEGQPLVVVGNEFLGSGDQVPRYSNVRVKSIAPSEVVYVYQDKEFPVEVVGAF